jgi:NAD(P)-dependent dehydrogenase (short-subunit alcohol dehydrogenase family)
VMTANAGILGRAHRKSLVDIAEDELRELFEVNFMGVWSSFRYAIPAIEQSGGGAMTVTASTSAIRGLAKAPAYAASKGAIVALALSLAADLFPLIRVNVVAPGSMATQIAKNAAIAKGVEESAVLAHAHPAGMPDAIHAARAHLYLASDDALHVNGQLLAVDGGASSLHRSAP